MAIYSPSPLVSRISGNIGGVNFAGAIGGRVIRSAIHRTNQRTQAQTDHRAQISIADAAWRSLSEAQRTQWNRTATRIMHRGRLGTRRPMHGRELFWVCNAQATTPDVGLQLDTPTTVSIPPPTFVSVAFTEGVSFLVILSIPFGSAPIYVSLFGARSFSTARPRTFRQWRWLQNTSGAGILPPINIQFSFTHALGQPKTNEWVGFRFASHKAGAIPSRKNAEITQL